MDKSYRTRIYLIFWFGILVCFAATGVRGFVTSRHAPWIEGTGPYGSSDGLLGEFAGFHHGSEKILKTCESIPVAQPSVVFWPARNNNSSICHLIISYLAWPRRVEGMAASREQLGRDVEQLRGESNGGIWLFGLAPSANLKRGAVVDRGLLFFPAEEPR